MTKMTKAFNSGHDDGVSWIDDERQLDPTNTIRASDYTGGSTEPDEGLINACDTKQLAKVLGLTIAQVQARGPQWDAALADYNRGWRAGVVESSDEQ